MATQKLDSEIDVARKYLHLWQRELYRTRFGIFTNFPNEDLEKDLIQHCLKHITYWRTRYNAACAVEQERELTVADLPVTFELRKEWAEGEDW